MNRLTGMFVIAVLFTASLSQGEEIKDQYSPIFGSMRQRLEEQRQATSRLESAGIDVQAVKRTLADLCDQIISKRPQQGVLEAVDQPICVEDLLIKLSTQL